MTKQKPPALAPLETALAEHLAPVDAERAAKAVTQAIRRIVARRRAQRST